MARTASVFSGSRRRHRDLVTVVGHAATIIDDVAPNAGEIVASFDGRPVTYGFGELDMLVASPALLDLVAGSVDEMRLANLFCWAAEFGIISRNGLK
jgi:hypothetical protein